VRVFIHDHAEEAARAAAARAAAELRAALARKGRATFMAATGTSQIEFLQGLTNEPDIDWSKTTMYHLDEYVGLPESDSAALRRYLRERLIDRVRPGTVHLIHGDTKDPEAECERLGDLLKQDRIDIACVGIGENGHLAFNDPPADFATDDALMVVELAEEARAQQVHEGWFGSLADVPRLAITVTVKQIMSSAYIVCTVPGARKAQAVRCALEGPVSQSCPASILRTHAHADVFLDSGSAALLDRASVGSYSVDPVRSGPGSDEVHGVAVQSRGGTRQQGDQP